MKDILPKVFTVIIDEWMNITKSTKYEINSTKQNEKLFFIGQFVYNF